jgi:hypothetical protein
MEPHGQDVLADEQAELTPGERAWLAADERLRERARQLAARLGLDEGDVYHQLKQLARTPTERLRRGLAHGRRRPRLSY